VPAEAVRCVGGYWQPKYSVPNARMVEAVQVLHVYQREVLGQVAVAP
jgi:hypothetical protein